MYLADFDYTITYICGEDNTATNALFHITSDQSLLDAIITSYKADPFAKQLLKDIDMGVLKGQPSLINSSMLVTDL